MRKFDEERVLRIIPEYPRTRHLPWKPNAARTDLIASEDECQEIFTSPFVYLEEKVDGANCGMAWIDDEPVIRNRNHLLRKSFQARTPAKQQFAPVWNWFYEHRENFELLDIIAGPVSVYGEWLYAVHGVEYNKLPTWFIAYDLYDYDEGKFICPSRSRGMLADAGFTVVPLLHEGPINDWEQIEGMTNQPSAYSDATREGVYVKIGDGKHIVKRFKMVRQGFIQGEHWNERVIKKNTRL